ncbi:MAG TPA: hypothetical protein VIO36_06670 [Anaerolineaceae bacterium]
MRIVIADRHTEVRAALRLLLENLDSSWSVIAEAGDLKTLQTCGGLKDADLILLEWSLPGLGSAAPAEKVLTVRQSGLRRIIALGSCLDDCEPAQAAGVDAFISKIEPPDRIITLLREIGQGHP